MGNGSVRFLNTGKDGYDPRVYWIWLQHAFKAGSYKPYHIFSRYSGGVREFYENGPHFWDRLQIVSEKELAGLMHYSLDEAQALLEYCIRLGYEVITPECEKYPQALKNIFDPPAVLYVQGTFADVDSVPTIGIVGARKADKEFCDVAKAIAHQITLGGGQVVSGGALGIDSAALEGAMSAAGHPISVLPASLNSNYLIQNSHLRKRILEWGGALVSEYPVENTVDRGTFQVRNRLISGLSCGTLIVQAGNKSGTMITAKRAAEQSRDVFVYPGPDGDKRFEGSRQLIENGAKPVLNGESILREYAARFSSSEPPKPKTVSPEFSADIGAAQAMLSGLGVKSRETVNDGALVFQKGTVEDKVYEALTPKPQELTELMQKTELTVSELLSVLTKLELMGAVKSSGGRMYSLS